MNNPPAEIMEYAERIYIRMEAEQVIKTCLDNGEISPFTKLVEELVLAGQPAYGVMREILEEIRSLRVGMSEEGILIRTDLSKALVELGFEEREVMDLNQPETIRKICKNELNTHLEQQTPGLDVDTCVILTELCFEASDQLKLLAGRMRLLADLEAHLRDWYQGIAYQIFHEGFSNLGAYDDNLH
jgi:hypothetical protein